MASAWARAANSKLRWPRRLRLAIHVVVADVSKQTNSFHVLGRVHDLLHVPLRDHPGVEMMKTSPIDRHSMRHVTELGGTIDTAVMVSTLDKHNTLGAKHAPYSTPVCFTGLSGRRDH